MAGHVIGRNPATPQWVRSRSARPCCVPRWCMNGPRAALCRTDHIRVPQIHDGTPSRAAEDVGEPVGALIDHPPAAIRPDDRTIEPGYPTIPRWLSSARSTQIVPVLWLGWAAVSLPAE